MTNESFEHPDGPTTPVPSVGPAGPPTIPTPPLGGTPPAQPWAPPPTYGTPPTPPAVPQPPVAPLGSGPQLFAPPPTLPPTPPGAPQVGAPQPGPKQKSGSVRAALVGGLVGTLVVALVGSVLWFAAPRRTEQLLTEARPSLTLDETGLDLQGVLSKVRPSVVSIHTGLAGAFGAGEAAGSGVVLSEDGLLLTNAHVVEGAVSIEVAFSDGERLSADLVGSFPQDDVALVKVRSGGPFTPAELGTSGDLQVGDDVVAIGNALNLGAEPTVTVGIVSALDRPISAPNVQLEHLIQTDAAINQGNSGGPLLNAAGQVVGINTAIIAAAQNLGFALAIDDIKPLIEDIKNGNADVSADSAFLGVSTTNVDEQRAEILDRFGIDVETGAFVSEVVPGSAAEDAGLEPGDVLIAVDGQEVKSKEDVGDFVRDRDPGDEIEVVYLRDGQEQTGSAQLGRRVN
jgi:putative serine protease PepD